MVLLSLFFFLSIEFFKVYGISFSLKLLDNEILSGWRDLMNSALYELSGGFYLKIVFALIFFSPVALNLSYRRIRFIDIVKQRRGSAAERVLLLYPPLLILLVIILSLLPGSGRSGEMIIDEIRMRKGEKPVLNVRDIAKNPLASFFPVGDEKVSESMDRETADRSHFTYGFNTGSLVSSRVYPRKNLIPRGKKFNIVLYFFESTSSRYINEKIKGRYVVPNWRKLMKNAFVAENHYANFPLSANSLYSVLTSSYDDYSNDLVIQKYPGIRTQTIYEILKEKGYRTCLIHTGSLLYAGQRKFLERRNIDTIIEYKDLIKKSEYKKIVGYGIDERAMIKPGIDFINKERNKPFLLTFFPLNPHHPYAIPDSGFRITGTVPENAGRKTERWMNYLNSLHYADYAMGELLRKFEKNGLLENTLFILLADHGQAFYQHRENFNHRRFLYEENVHVPFLIYNKRIFPQPYFYRGISRHIDILPTLLDILGIDRNPRQEGISLLSSHREQYALLHTSWKHEFFGIRDGSWKYIYRVEDEFEELYDLKKDPGEIKNLAPVEKNRVTLFRHLVSRARLYNYKYYKKILYGDQQ